MDFRILYKDWKTKPKVKEGNRRWREDGKCGIYFQIPVSDGKFITIPAECDPYGEYPCCHSNIHSMSARCTRRTSWCLNPRHSVDYARIYREWEVSLGKQKWRYDRRCGPAYLLPDGTPAQCNPDGEFPCCNFEIMLYHGVHLLGTCSSRIACYDLSLCVFCTDYQVLYRHRRDSRGKQRWRSDGRCGRGFILPDGTPAECNPDGEFPCCDMDLEPNKEDQLWCGNSALQCVCPSCVDYKVLKSLRIKSASPGNLNCSIARIATGYLKYVCSDDIRNTNQLFYKYKCAKSNVYYETKIDRSNSIVTAVCENDPHVYQACGFNFKKSKKAADTNVLCGGYFRKVRQNEYKFIAVDSKGEDCSTANDVDCHLSRSYSGIIDCDGKCNIYNCYDESNCNGYRYGTLCFGPKYSDALYYQSVHSVCDGINECRNYKDEIDCIITKKTLSTCTHYHVKVRDKKTRRVPILEYTRCSALPYCLDYTDQTNCSDIERVGGYCEIDGYNSSVSKLVVCKEFDERTNIPIELCDGNIQMLCPSPSASDCRIHKHKICDGKSQCYDGRDELDDMCDVKTDKLNFSCTRRFNLKMGTSHIPISWIMDNEKDCLGGEDENSTLWEFCPGEKIQVKLPDEACQDVFLCHNGRRRHVRFDKLCDEIESCGDGGETELCRIARDFPVIDKVVPYINTTSTVSVRKLCDETTSSCETKEFIRPWGEVFGELKMNFSVPTSKVKCGETFGEQYLFLSCMNLCLEPEATCPLEAENRKLEYDSCPGQYPNRAFTLGNNSFLTFADELDSGLYHQNFFRCDNDTICIKYEQVCDLVDHCGDMQRLGHNVRQEISLSDYI